jgi:hypothetical protein
MNWRPTSVIAFHFIPWRTLLLRFMEVDADEVPKIKRQRLQLDSVG